MSLPLKYCLICEGMSEWTYVQRLKALLSGRLPLMEDGFTPRLDFYPHITNDKIGGGSFVLVKRTYRKLRPQNKRLPLRIWVDCDIYIRNDTEKERANATGYAARGNMPEFNFMVMNFEDFVAMHFNDDVFEVWKCKMKGVGHFSVPLHSAEYKPHFEEIWQRHMASSTAVYKTSYTKGSLPEDFVTVESLKNMIRHCNDEMLKSQFSAYAPAGAFPMFLADRLKEAYPETFNE